MAKSYSLFPSVMEGKENCNLEMVGVWYQQVEILLTFTEYKTLPMTFETLDDFLSSESRYFFKTFEDLLFAALLPGNSAV